MSEDTPTTHEAWTAGPWHVRFSFNGDWMQGIQGFPAEGERYGEMVVNRGIAKPKSERGLANARLIAAAPDLYEALADAADQLEALIDFACRQCELESDGQHERLALQAARAALARARTAS